MDIDETTPESERTFMLNMTKPEVEEIRIAFVHMLSISFYTDTQKSERVLEMVRKIDEAM